MKNKKSGFLFLLMMAAQLMGAESLNAYWTEYNNGFSDDEALARAMQESWNSELPPRRERIAQVPEEQSRGACCLEDECCICLEKYNDRDQVSILPCKHGIHTACIDGCFVRGDNRCPICRNNADYSRIIAGLYQDLKPMGQQDRQNAEKYRAAIADSAQHSGQQYGYLQPEDADDFVVQLLLNDIIDVRTDSFYLAIQPRRPRNSCNQKIINFLRFLKNKLCELGCRIRRIR